MGTPFGPTEKPSTSQSNTVTHELESRYAADHYSPGVRSTELAARDIGISTKLWDPFLGVLIMGALLFLGF